MVMETIALSSILAGGGVLVVAISREMTDNGPHFKVFWKQASTLLQISVTNG